MPLKKHGEAAARSAEYETWVRMKRRCLSPCSENHKKNYRDRGITVCAHWIHSFEHFLKDMGRRPSSGHTIERLDGNLGYQPGNCVWATRTKQSRNRPSICKINLEMAENIRREYMAGVIGYRQLAKRYGFKSHKSIIEIIQGKKWKPDAVL